ncbi:TauD-domain-containing protein [Nadsonia fulvescens var. elongata DSM 6958]|uniref:TauD-domain-containing protein n=1 Tax=Nadsonia fulvescens var. elongata DSM 6958 TaxID=857566 RepID=A0A1E3PJJ3_9ASCO|nr:TauD-domain-containing protein [Nadsonia fulvescens var. elongata DSM 6958]
MFYSRYSVLPANSNARLLRHNIDITKGYPERFASEKIPFYLDEAIKIRNEELPYIVRGKNADPEKKTLLSAAREVIDLTKHIGTEIVGLQLSDLNEQQLDELALLIAERTVVFFKNQDLSPQKQLEIGKFYGIPEVHAQVPFVPGFPGVTVLWPDHQIWEGRKANFKNPGGASRWHTDLVHETQPSGITHLHNDEIPSTGGDTIWSSGYGAYEKLSPAFQEFLEGKKAVFTSAHTYVDRNNPLSGPKHIEREHLIVRTHPVTGWKSLFVNRAMTKEIVGLEPEESKIILEYLYDVYEKSLDIQVRFKWQPTKHGLGTSALWDNRISQHNAVWDYEGQEPRHGTRVSSLAEVPFFDPNSQSRRESLENKE